MFILTYYDAVKFLEIGKAYKVSNPNFANSANCYVIILVLSIEPLFNSGGFAIVCGFGLSKFICKQGLFVEEKQNLGLLNSVYETYKENTKQFIGDIGPITLCEEI